MWVQLVGCLSKVPCARMVAWLMPLIRVGKWLCKHDDGCTCVGRIKGNNSFAMAWAASTNDAASRARMGHFGESFGLQRVCCGAQRVQ